MKVMGIRPGTVVKAILLFTPGKIVIFQPNYREAYPRQVLLGEKL